MIGAFAYITATIRSGLTGLRAAGERLAAAFRRYPGPAGFVLGFLAVALCAHLGLYLADEGNEWYGAQRVLAGEVPLRDFSSYDPGRYYCLAAVMWLLHSPGLVAFHLGLAVFAGAAVWLANSLVFSDGRRRGFWLWLMVSVTFAVWLFPRHKIVDIALSVVLTASLAALLRQPTRLRCFLGGLCVGLVAVFGRNHGLYGALAGIAALAIVVWGERRATVMSSFSYGCLGVIAGYAPMLLALALVPGFREGLWTTIRVYFELGSTNNPVPIPWPWRVPLTVPWPQLVRYWLVGCLLIVQPVFGGVVTLYSVWRLRTRKQAIDPVLLASGLMALLYTHHAYARAGLEHLAQAIYPLLIGMLVLVLGLGERKSVAVAVTGICAVSVFLMLPQQLWYERWKGGDWVDIQIGSDVISTSPYVARREQVLAQVIGKYAPAGREFMVMPYLPGSYALFDRRAPVWETYATRPADSEVQQATIQRIRREQPAFVLLQSGTLDNNPIYAYANTNPQVYHYLLGHFVAVEDPLIPSFWGWTLYLPAPDVNKP